MGVVISNENLGIPFIDDSGSSSCTSSLFSEEVKYLAEDDCLSLNGLLDDAASRELSFNDLASLSCGYASLEPSDGRSEGGTSDTKDNRSKLQRKLSQSLPSSIDSSVKSTKDELFVKSTEVIVSESPTEPIDIMKDSVISLPVPDLPLKYDLHSCSSHSSRHSDNDVPGKPVQSSEDSTSNHSNHTHEGPDNHIQKKTPPEPPPRASTTFLANHQQSLNDTGKRSFPTLTDLDPQSPFRSQTHRRVQSISMPIRSFSPGECSTPLVPSQCPADCQVSTISVCSDISSPFSTGSRTTQTTTASEVCLIIIG